MRRPSIRYRIVEFECCNEGRTRSYSRLRVTGPASPHGWMRKRGWASGTPSGPTTLPNWSSGSSNPSRSRSGSRNVWVDRLTAIARCPGQGHRLVRMSREICLNWPIHDREDAWRSCGEPRSAGVSTRCRRTALSGTSHAWRASCRGSTRGSLSTLAGAVGRTHGESGRLRLFVSMPYRKAWELLETEPETFREAYWEKVEFDAGTYTAQDVHEMVDGLLKADRPLAALKTVSHSWDAVETSRLTKLLHALAGVTKRFDASGICPTLRTMTMVDGRAGRFAKPWSGCRAAKSTGDSSSALKMLAVSSRGKLEKAETRNAHWRRSIATGHSRSRASIRMWAASSSVLPMATNETPADRIRTRIFNADFRTVSEGPGSGDEDHRGTRRRVQLETQTGPRSSRGVLLNAARTILRMSTPDRRSSHPPRPPIPPLSNSATGHRTRRRSPAGQG